MTGESEPVLREAGDRVLSGSFVVEGEGAFEATAVGADSHAAQAGGDGAGVPSSALPAREGDGPPADRDGRRDAPARRRRWGSRLAIRDVSQAQAVETLTAAIVNIVPEGLILLVSLTMAVSAAKMARRGVLAQQLNAIESLASVSVLCTDKTGTLTEASLRVVELIPADGVQEDELARALGRFAASAPSRNATLEAVHAAQLGRDGAGALEPTALVPFSSRRRWSALELDGERLVLGAPEALLAARRRASPRRVRATPPAAGGCWRSPPPARRSRQPRPTRRCRTRCARWASSSSPSACARTRPTRWPSSAPNEVALKVLSGDNPATVGAITRDAGIPADTGALDGGALPEGDEALLAAVRAAPAIGRISPADKARVVRVLADAGEYVGMLGDGVNDVPALKQARLAIAQGSGTQMARAVSDLVLVSGEFGEVPRMVHEGRQILRNIQRVARLFVTKALFTAFLLVTIAIPTGVFPLLPRQFTLTSSLTIGIPAFLLALAPSSGPWRPEGFLRAIARFSLPAGLAAGIGILSAYLLARYAFDLSLTEARTVTAATVVTSGLAIVIAARGRAGQAPARGGSTLRADGARVRARLRHPRGARVLRSRHADQRDRRRVGDRHRDRSRAARGRAARRERDRAQGADGVCRIGGMSRHGVRRDSSTAPPSPPPRTSP